MRVLGLILLASVLAGIDSAAAPPSQASLERAIADVEVGRRTTPIVGEPAADGSATVTFLARRSNGRVPRIVSDVTGWGERADDNTFDFDAGAMTPVGRTGWYALHTKVAPRARIEYLVAYGRSDYRLDPHNPRHVDAPRASELVMPGYVAPEELVGRPASPGGRIDQQTIESAAIGAPCRVTIYTPAGYQRGRVSYPVAVLAGVAPRQAPRILDWLIAHHAIEAIVAVFVEPQLPDNDRRAGAPMRTLLTRELPQWVASRYAVTRDASARAIVGVSFSAKDAFDAALAPDAYGRLGLLIPGRRIAKEDLDAVESRRPGRLQVAIVAGQYDTGNLETAHAVRDTLSGAGDAVEYLEVPEGHSPRTWLNHLRSVLVALFPPERSSPPEPTRAAVLR